MAPKLKITEYADREYGEEEVTRPAQYRWALVGANGEPMCWSEPYPSPENAERGAEDAKAAMALAEIEREF